jgi:hypothetical protein
MENHRLPKGGLELENMRKGEDVVLWITGRKCGQLREKGIEFCMWTQG